MIPKIIFQCAPSYDALPREILSNIVFLKKNNPGWEHKFFSNDDMRAAIQDFGFDISLLNPEYEILIADIFRYIAMYKYGGVYLDIKSSCTMPFEAFLWNKTVCLVKWRTCNKLGDRSVVGHHPLYDMHGLHGEVANWFMAAEKGHSLFLRTLEKIQRNIRNYPSKFCNGVGQPAVLSMTGPVPFTLSADEAGLYAKAIEYDRVGLRYSVFGTMSGHREMYAKHYSQLRTPLVVATA